MPHRLPGRQLALVLLLSGSVGPLALADEPADRSLLVVFLPRRTATLAARVQSQVTSVAHEVGQRVAKGKDLVTLSTEVYRPRVSEAEAKLAAASARRDRARALAELDRFAARIAEARAVYDGAAAQLVSKQALFKDNSLSESQLQEAKTEAAVAKARLSRAETEARAARIGDAADLRVAEAEVATARALLSIARAQLAACRVRAPFDGRVARVVAQRHESVRPGDALIEIVDDRTLWATVLVPSRLGHRVPIGRRVAVRVVETSAVVEARVSHRGALVDPASATLKLYLELPNKAGAILGGMRGSVSLAGLVPDGGGSGGGSGSR